MCVWLRLVSFLRFWSSFEQADTRVVQARAEVEPLDNKNTVVFAFSCFVLFCFVFVFVCFGLCRFG